MFDVFFLAAAKRNPPPPTPAGPPSQQSSTSSSNNRSNPSSQQQQSGATIDNSAVVSTSQVNEKVAAPSVQPVEQRWEESEGMYLHKKFKKMASSAAVVTMPPAQAAVDPKPPTAAPPGDHPPVLKHSALSMLHSPQPLPSRPQPDKTGAPPPPPPQQQQQPSTSHETSPNSSKKKNVCSYCQLVCAKPSVLEKHMRTHTNERPYPCEACGFAFKTKSNLYKHRKSRTHNLKVEKGIDSSKEEIMAELGESGQEEAMHSPEAPSWQPQQQPQYLVSTGANVTTASFTGMCNKMLVSDT